MLEREPDRLRSQLEQLQTLTHNALKEMRGLIAHLRPQGSESAGWTKP
jgi:signal transduction histidine kinase